MASATHQRRQNEPSRPPALGARPYQEHERAVLAAEARALALTLHSYGILTCDTEEQAIARASRDELDKGGDAARACLALIETRTRLGATR